MASFTIFEAHEIIFTKSDSFLVDVFDTIMSLGCLSGEEVATINISSLEGSESFALRYDLLFDFISLIRSWFLGESSSFKR